MVDFMTRNSHTPAKQGPIPFGFARDNDRPHLLVPVEEEQKVLSLAFDALNRGRSFREVRDWLESHHSVGISYSQLFRRYKKHIVENMSRFINLN
jgi:hypothetical protein